MSPQKPFPSPYPKPKRLPERKAVTIVGGFRCDEGIVLCADTQETIQGTRTHTPKLRLEPRRDFYGNGGEGKDDLMVAFAGAGDGPFIDKLVDRAWEDVQLATNIDDAAKSIEGSIKKTYKEYGHIFQPGY